MVDVCVNGARQHLRLHITPETDIVFRGWRIGALPIGIVKLSGVCDVAAILCEISRNNCNKPTVGNAFDCEHVTVHLVCSKIWG